MNDIFKAIGLNMKKIKNESENKSIILSKKDYKLLIILLKKYSDERSDMVCNDPEEDEEKLFSEEERFLLNFLRDLSLYKNV